MQNTWHSAPYLIYDRYFLSLVKVIIDFYYSDIKEEKHNWDTHMLLKVFGDHMIIKYKRWCYKTVSEYVPLGTMPEVSWVKDIC